MEVLEEAFLLRCWNLDHMREHEGRQEGQYDGP